MTTDHIRAVLRQHAAPRERVVDDHMFTLDGRNFPMGTFRLQLFVAPGRRPVAVATQTVGEGTSLMIGSEGYAAEIWERHFPDDAEPPIWIERQILSSGRFDYFQLVTFVHTGRYTLTDPDWCPLSDDQLAELVGVAVDHGRGEGYVPPPSEPRKLRRYDTRWLILFPRPRPFREACMKGRVPWRRRLGRQLIPHAAARDCCWYHGGDWHQVCKTATRLTRKARRQGIPGADITRFVQSQPEAQAMSQWDREALFSLFTAPIHLAENRRSYVNGQHRAQAMLDAGVRRTIVITWVPPQRTRGQMRSPRAATD
jgi:hypothetical protein